MINLSVNVNKIATLRNARGGNIPNVQQVAMDCERFGADGITVHPRPDERHIRRSDVFELRPLVRTEFNIEGYPSEQFMELTSSAGWEVESHMAFLTDIVDRLKEAGIRTSIFVGTDLDNIRAAARTGADRVELYTGPFAEKFDANPERAVAPFTDAAIAAHNAGLGLNAGHDLNLHNLKFFQQHVPYLMEVSIGHALIADALYLGLEKTIQAYKDCLK